MACGSWTASIWATASRPPLSLPGARTGCSSSSGSSPPYARTVTTMRHDGPIRAVLFDAADTLFRVRGSVGATYADMAARFGARVEPARVEERFRATFPTMPPLAFAAGSGEEVAGLEYAWWRTLVTRVFADLTFGDFDGFFAALFEQFARGDAWELFPETCAALAALRERG